MIKTKSINKILPESAPPASVTNGRATYLLTWRKTVCILAGKVVDKTN